MSYRSDNRPLNAPNEKTILQQLMSPKRRPRKRKYKRSEDPYLDAIETLRSENKIPKERHCRCPNDDGDVCNHLHRLALARLSEIDSDPDDWASFHDSFPAATPTHARHGTPEREDDLSKRIKGGYSSHHPQDRLVDSDGTGQSTAIFLCHLQLVAMILKRGNQIDAAIAAYKKEVSAPCLREGGDDE